MTSAHAGQHLAGAHAVSPKRRSHLLHLPRRHAARHHLGYRGDDGPVHARVAHEQVLREVAAPPELGDAQVDDPHAGDERAVAVAVPLVAVGARVLGLGVHDLVHERLGHRPDQLADVDHAVVESRHLGQIGADCC